MNADEIVRELTRRSWRFGVSVLLSDEKDVDCDGMRVSGWFCGDDKKLVVGCGVAEDKWLGTLLHEYSHLTQWAENCQIWRDDAKVNTDIDEWLDGKAVRNIGKVVALRQELEADCERRAVRLMRELDAPIDRDRYIRGANAYIHFHNIMLEKRKWYAPGRGPYNVPEVLAAANATLDTEYRKTSPALRAALLTCI